MMRRREVVDAQRDMPIMGLVISMLAMLALGIFALGKLSASIDAEKRAEQEADERRTKELDDIKRRLDECESESAWKFMPDPSVRYRPEQFVARGAAVVFGVDELGNAIPWVRCEDGGLFRKCELIDGKWVSPCPEDAAD